jgi:amino-acid N-acetyltransferase
MKGNEFQIGPAETSDLDEILALLTTVGLPPEGVAEHLRGFVIARNANGRLVGCAGIERYDAFGLLRSVAVAPELQSAGLGSQIVSEILRIAASLGVGEVVLLTTTARDFFAYRFRFEETSRAEYDAQFAASPEWKLPRCSSALAMRLKLASMEAIA